MFDRVKVSGMKVAVFFAAVLGVLLVLTWAPPLPVQADAQLQLLIVNESQNPDISKQIQLLSVPLRQLGLFATIDLMNVTVSSDFADPLGLNSPGGKQYDMIVVVPLTLGQSNLRQIWLSTCAITSSTPAGIIRAIQAIKNIVAGGTQGAVRAVGVQDDFIPGYLADFFFKKHGWLHC